MFDVFNIKMRQPTLEHSYTARIHVILDFQNNQQLLFDATLEKHGL